MWMIFDIEGNFVGMITEESRNQTNIFEVLEEAGYALHYISNTENLKSYNF